MTPEQETVLDVRCSCGEVAVLRITDKCRCDNPAWKYHSAPIDRPDRESQLWHCGAEGHYQAGLRDHVEHTAIAIAEAEGGRGEGR